MPTVAAAADDVKEFTTPAREKAKSALALTVAEVMSYGNSWLLAPLKRKGIEAESGTQMVRDSAASQERVHRMFLEADEAALKEIVDRSILREVVDRVERDTPEENIQPPPLHVAGPALEAMRFSLDEPELRDLYANLLATCMDRDKAKGVTPGFIDVIRQISPDEARIVHFFAQAKVAPMLTVYGKKVIAQSETRNEALISKYTTLSKDAVLGAPRSVRVYLSNLSRLGVLALPDDPPDPNMNVWMPDDKLNKALETHPEVVAAIENAKSLKQVDGSGPLYTAILFAHGCIRFTEFGFAFSRACNSPRPVSISSNSP